MQLFNLALPGVGGTPFRKNIGDAIDCLFFQSLTSLGSALCFAALSWMVRSARKVSSRPAKAFGFVRRYYIVDNFNPC
jgi:hypothetical protein